MRRPAVVASALVAAVAGIAGCGIRATSVPVDAGAAPTRVSCAAPSASPTSDATGRATAAVYLVCSQRISPVQRTVPVKSPNGFLTAQLLVMELQRKPDQAEEKSGFASEVPGGLEVTAPVKGDPPGTLRLTQDPQDLPSYAVGQLVCTFANTPAGQPDHSVLLGGPDPTVPARRYRCDDALRTRPEAGATAGTSVS